MSAYIDTFDEEFLCRTKKIIADTPTEYKFTLLLNCTLALICLPIENMKGNNTEIIDEVCETLEKLEVSVELIKKPDGVKQEKLNYFKLKALRNGIAHLNIESVNEKDKLQSFIINGDSYDHKIKFSFTFAEETLQNFSYEMLNIYLRYARSKRN